MLKKHTNRQGITILIGQLMDEKLLAYTMGVLKKCVRARYEVENPNKVNPFTRALYGMENMTDPAEAAHVVRRSLEFVGPYINEIFLRGLEATNVRRALQATMGRTGAIMPVSDRILSMSEGDLGPDEEDDDNPDYDEIPL